MKNSIEKQQQLFLKDKPLDRRFPLINHCNKMRKANCER